MTGDGSKSSLEKGKISSLQMAILLYFSIIYTAVLIVPGLASKYARNDVWISPIWGSLVGFIVVLVAYRLHQWYPRLTFIEYSEHIMGRVLGKVLGLWFLFVYFTLTGHICREYAEFISSYFLMRTPIIYIISTMMVLCCFAVRGGLEVIARLGQLYFPFLVITLVIFFALLSPYYDLNNIFPILGHGIAPTLRGSVTSTNWFGEFILIAFLFPFISDNKKGLKWGLASVSGVLATMIAIDLVVLFVVGMNMSISIYPLLDAVSYIQYGDFFENLVPLIMAIWVFGLFIKISVFVYSCVIGTAQLIKLHDYRPVVFPFGVLIVFISIWDVPNYPRLSKFVQTIQPFNLGMVQIAIPLLLFLVAYVKKKREERKVQKGRIV
ncbi:MAG: spore germination protein [Paenibacillus sp.]|jgi:spore germination protein KB|nr:spore germination protein [Paenibacillus sp.]